MKQYKIAENAKFNSLEIAFNEKPNADTRTALKSFGFRWNPKKSIWYGFASIEEIEKAINGAKVEKTSAPKVADNQAELKERFMQDICKIWDDKSMQEYCRKNAAYIVELENGQIMEIEKPSIKTTFCFGYGMYLQCTDEEQKRAYDAEENARTNESYFFNENMEKINEEIENFKKVLSGEYEAYKYLHYTGQEKESFLRAVSTCKVYQNPEYEPGWWSNHRELEKLTFSEVENIIKGLEVVKASFEKRLKTYLKKYGTSKLKTWTYLID